MICPRDLINGFKHKEHQVGPEQLWQVQPNNHDPPMIEYFMLSTDEDRAITPAPYKELPPVDQDMVKARGDGDRGQGNEELARLTANLSLKIPSQPLLPSSAHPSAHFTRAYNLLSGPNPNQSTPEHTNGCTHGMNLSRRKPSHGRCTNQGWQRRRPSSRMSGPWRRFTSRSTRWRNRRGSNVNTWVGK